MLAIAKVAPDPLFTRLMEANRKPQPSDGLLGAGLVITAWKAGLLGVLCLAVAVWREGGVGQLFRGLSTGVSHVALVAVTQGAAQLGFTLSFLLTDAATALLIISLNPLWAALLGFCCLRDALPCHTVCALLFACLSVGVVFLPDLLALRPATSALATNAPAMATAGAEGPTAERDTSALGALAAFGTGLCLAGYLTTIRHAVTRCPRANMLAGAGLGALLAALVALAASEGQASPWILRGTAPPFLPLALADAASLTAAYVALAIAPTLLTGTEVAIVLLIQVPLSPLLVYLVLHEAPTPWTIGGGAILLATLAVHELVGARGRGQTKPDADPADATVVAERDAEPAAQTII